jgi:hypothetical protein
VDAAVGFLDGSEQATMAETGGAAIFMGGRVAVIAEKGAFPEPLRLVLKPQPIKPLVNDVISTTAGLYLAPAGFSHAPIRFEIEAQPLHGGDSVKQFDQSLRLVFDARLIPGVAPDENWTVAYEDETDPGRWYGLRLRSTTRPGWSASSPTTSRPSAWATNPASGTVAGTHPW